MATHPPATERSAAPDSGRRNEISFAAPLDTGEELWARLSFALLGFCSVAYFFAAVSIGIREPLWMDEVLADWMSQLSFSSILPALFHGTMSSPPVYFYLLHAVRGVFGGSALAMRMPSILAIYATGAVLYLLMRRRFAPPFAALAMVFCLETGLLGYATQIREYALVTLCFALAMWLWSSPNDPVSLRRVAGITLLLAAGVSLHFYAVLLVPAMALMEILWSLANRRIRPTLWIGMVIAGGSIFAWLPLMRQIMTVTGKYAASSNYFGSPTLSRLMMAYEDLAFGGKLPILACVFLAGMAAYFFWTKIAGSGRFPPVPDFDADSTGTIEIIVLATIAIPLLVFLFARFTKGTFNERYAIAGALGFAMLAAMLIARLQIGVQMSAALMLCSAALLFVTPSHQPSGDPFGMQLLAQTPDSDPIVVGEGLAFLELEQAANPALQKRLVYLTSPAGVINPDPTNEDLVRRWRLYRPGLDVEDPSLFLRQNAHFYVLHSSQSTDVITPWLIRMRRLSVRWNKPISKNGDDKNVWLFEANP